MSETGKQDLQDYLFAWANMMIVIWQEKLIDMKVNDTWELYNSFVNHVMIHSGGNGAKIEFAFLQYGFYVNEGVGKEIGLGNDGDLVDVSSYNLATGVFEISREPKPWFDKGWFKSIYALQRDVGRIYGDIAAKNIVFHLNNIT
jgi:hypothetical protein